MVDVFEEVEEQLRSDRYKTLALKALPWLAGLAVLALVVALGFWALDSWRSKAAAQASERYAAGLVALAQGDQAGAFSAFDEVAESKAKGYAALALMMEGGMRMDAGKTDEAVVLFDKSAQAAPNAVIGDMARLKSAFALMDTAPYADIEGRLTPLTQDDRPYRIEAKEALAFAKLMAGKAKEARGDFAALSLGFDSSDATRERARAAMSLIDSGSAAAMPAAVKAAMALPPMPPQAPQAAPVQPGAAQ